MQIAKLILRGTEMKKFSLISFALMLVAVLGCSGNDLDRGTSPRGAKPLPANEAAGAQGSRGSAPSPTTQTDAHASGGSSLEASLPYSQPNTPAASQNLNAAPFLVAAEPHKAGEIPAQPWSPGLTSRADGTMYGPTDQPAAGAGPGMMPAPEGKVSPGKQTPQKPKTSKPK